MRGRDLSAQQNHLTEIISSSVESTADWSTPIPNVVFFRRDAPTDPEPCLIEPSVVLVAHGRKQMLLGSDKYPYDTSRFLITSLDLPATSQVVEASLKQPCVGLLLKLDLRILAELIAQGDLPPLKNKRDSKSVGLGTVTPSLLEPFTRLLDLLNEPEAIDVLSPLIQREIHYRLLLSDQAPLLRQIVSIDSQGHRISRAIDWLKLNYATAFRIEELAARVHMSAPTFHHHFRQLTAMSPLQYQKWLRLHEAKRLMLNEHLDAASAAFNVGYESPSQFSREYNRMFGAPPRRDIETLRKQANNFQA